jgi:hypothetical protein
MYKDEKIINYSIYRVKTIAFNINEGLFSNENASVKIEVAQNIGVNLELSFVNCKITVYIYYEGQQHNRLAEITVENIFKVEDLANLAVERDYFLPVNLLISIFGLSISHTRALFFANLSGTTYQQAIIPITDPVDFTRHFYPKLFEEKQQEATT